MDTYIGYAKTIVEKANENIVEFKVSGSYPWNRVYSGFTDTEYGNLPYVMANHPWWFIEFCVHFIGKILNISYLPSDCQDLCIICDMLFVLNDVSFSDIYNDAILGPDGVPSFFMWNLYIIYYPFFLIYMLYKILRTLYLKSSIKPLSTWTFWSLVPFSERIYIPIYHNIRDYVSQFSLITKLRWILKDKYFLTLKAKVLIIYGYILYAIRLLPWQFNWIAFKFIK